MNMYAKLMAAVMLAASLSAAAIAEEAPVEWDGLQKTKVKGIDLAYVRPGVDASAYSKIMLDPVQVAFSKDWKPERTGSRMPVSQEDRDRIAEGLAALAHDTFKEVLSKDGGYPVVTEPGPDVLRLSTGLADVYINAPDVPSAGRSRTYVANAGRMTLVAEFRDSETGALFARAVDAREARDNTPMTWSNSVTNSAEARRMVAQWAKIIRSRLDAVRAHAKGQ